MTMYNKDDIRKLIDRFFDGETTIEEERMLYTYFAGNEVDEEFIELREMMLDLASVAPDAATPEGKNAEDGLTKREATTHEPRVFPLAAKASKQWMRWAAVVAIAMLSATATYMLQSADNYCEAYIGGQRVTDEQRVMSEVNATLTALGNTGEDEVDEMLSGMFGE